MKTLFRTAIFLSLVCLCRAEFNYNWNPEPPASTVWGQSYSVDVSVEETENNSACGADIYKNGVLVSAGTHSGAASWSARCYSANADEGWLYATTNWVSDTTPPTQPGSFAAGTPTSTTLALSWSASTDNYFISNYEVNKDGVVQGTPTATNFTLTGLTLGTPYVITVRATDMAGNFSNASTLSLTHALWTPAITFAAMSKNTGDAPFALASSSNSGTAPTYSIVSQSPSGIISLSSGTVTILGHGTATLRVTYPAAANYAQGTADATLTVYRPQPANLASPSQTYALVNLTWEASVAPLTVAGYDIYRTLNGATVLLASVGNVLSYADTHVQPSKTYGYFVKARFVGGTTSPSSNSISASTGAIPDANANGIPDALETLFGTSNPTTDSSLNLKTHNPSL